MKTWTLIAFILMTLTLSAKNHREYFIIHYNEKNYLCYDMSKEEDFSYIQTEIIDDHKCIIAQKKGTPIVFMDENKEVSLRLSERKILITKVNDLNNNVTFTHLYKEMDSMTWAMIILGIILLVAFIFTLFTPTRR
ncbi:hypothetical protein AGMMS50249_6730 [candidate division SR1 bacterium]|nr:hypothetical protein AGMMS50249_6730 [candidate division SR1 bacterium]